MHFSALPKFFMINSKKFFKIRGEKNRIELPNFPKNFLPFTKWKLWKTHYKKFYNFIHFFTSMLWKILPNFCKNFGDKKIELNSVNPLNFHFLSHYDFYLNFLKKIFQIRSTVFSLCLYFLETKKSNWTP